MFLIMKATELMDQYECDADREPLAIVDDWHKWFDEHRSEINYSTEIYEWDGKEMKCIKGLYDYLSEGMALYYWDNDADAESEPPTVVYQYPEYSADQPVPVPVVREFQRIIEAEDYDDDYTIEEAIDEIHRTGNCGILDHASNRYYVYGEYRDGQYDLGY